VTPAVGLAALVFITLVWGTSFAIVKEALGHIPVPLLLAVRFSLAAACFAWVRFDRRAVVPALWLGLAGFAGFATQTVGLQFTSASNAAFITGLAVVLTPMLAAVVWRRRVAPRVFVAAGVAVAGLALLTTGAGGVAGLNVGDVWVLATAFTYAIYVVYLGEVAGRASVFALAGMQHLPMALLAWAWAWPERGALAEVPLFTFGAIAYLAVVSTALVAVLQTMAQRVVAAPLAALVFVLEPVFAAVFAAWWLGERLGPIGWLGGGMVVVAMAVSELRIGRWRGRRRAT
jgi:drug/metabolite transporter (DMT)-like permease